MRHNLIRTLLGCALLAICTAQAQSYRDGFLKQEVFPGKVRTDLLPGGDPGAPASTGFITSFEVGSLGDNYAQRVSGYFTPATTGDYVFFVAADDDTDLFLSTDANPANKKLIAQEASWSNNRQWLTPGGGASTPEDKRSDTFAASEWPTPGRITLTAGQKYYIEAVHHEGGGGDLLGVTVKRPTDPDPANGSAPSTAGGTWSVLQVALSVTTQPASTSVVENTSATFTVAHSAVPNVTFQWQVNGVDIAGATNATYRFTPTAADNTKVYRAVLRSGSETATSNPATLTVTNDTTAPTIASAGSFLDRNAILLAFSEAMLATGLNVPGNYSLSGGATVSGVEVIGDRTVILRTSSLTAGQNYTVTVSNLRDRASGGGNLVSPNAVTITQVTTPAGSRLNIAEYSRWAGIAIGDLDDTIAAGTAPDATVYVPSLESQVNVADTFTGRVRGYFIPPVTGNYVFYGSSDDGGLFFLSTDSDPANKKLIAQETGWSAARSWVSSPGGSNPDAKRSDRFASTEWPAGNTISLVAGLPYYAEIRFQEGGGGDNGEMTFKLEGEADPANGTPSRITGSNLVWFADVSTSAPIITRISTGTNYNKGARIVLEVQAIGQTPMTYQWRRNKLPIPGATSSTYVIESADHRHVGDYSVDITNAAGVLSTMGSDNNLRLQMNGAFVVEVEDYNYEAGKHVPAASQMPYLGNAYLGLKPTLDRDFFNDGDESGGAAFAYTRHAVADEGVLEMKGPGDAVDNALNRNRGTFSVTNNYAVGWTDIGDWQNYTRTYPTGKYAIYLAAAHDGLPADEDAANEINLVLSRVANPTIADNSTAGTEGGAQGLTKLGSFVSKATGAWSSNDLIPLTDDTGNLLEVNLGGTQTLRLTFNEADGDGDYFLMYCLDCAASPGRPTISITRAAGGRPSITFTGILQSATEVTGPYTDVTGATSPYTPPAGLARQFFRTRQ